MRIRLACTTILLGTVPSVLGWGAAGHEVVATIAQIYLHPSVLPTICNILGVEQNSPSCHLASIATWADRVRNQPGMRWSASLHYVGAKDDFPSKTCAFPGEAGWAGKEGANVLGGVRNVTGLLENYVTSGKAGPDELAEEAVKFLVHFVGDMHMPLHLTGRERGGNGIKVRFDNRVINLHSLWDSRLLSKSLRTIPTNYTRPLPLPYVERALRNTIYDPYVRRVVWEGLEPSGTWYPELPSWLVCPERVKASLSQNGQRVIGLAGHEPGDDTDDEIVCPYHWSSGIHPLNCDIVWPKELDDPKVLAVARIPEDEQKHNCHDEDHEEEVQGRPPHHPPHPSPYIELDTPEYAGVIEEKRIIEKLMAQGGIRLAAILNYLFVEPEARKNGLWVSQAL